MNFDWDAAHGDPSNVVGAILQLHFLLVLCKVCLRASRSTLRRHDEETHIEQIDASPAV